MKMKKELKIKWNMLISTAVMGTLNSPQLELLNIKPHKVIKKITSAFRLSDAIFKDESVVDMDSLLQAISADPHKAFDVLKDFELIDGFPEESTKNAIRLSIDKHPFLISLELDGFGGPFSFLFSENFKQLTNFENVDFVKIFMNNMISQSRVHGYSRMIIYVDSESVKFVPETEWQKEFRFLIISALRVIEQLTARQIDVPACIPYPNEDLESMTFDRLKKLMLREDELSENEEFVKLSNIKETLANLYAFRIRHLVSDSYNHINEERLKLGEDLRRNKRIAKGIKMHCAKLIEDLEIKNSDLSLLTQADLDALSKHEAFIKLETSLSLLVCNVITNPNKPVSLKDDAIEIDKTNVKFSEEFDMILFNIEKYSRINHSLRCTWSDLLNSKMLGIDLPDPDVALDKISINESVGAHYFNKWITNLIISNRKHSDKILAIAHSIYDIRLNGSIHLRHKAFSYYANLILLVGVIMKKNIISAKLTYEELYVDDSYPSLLTGVVSDYIKSALYKRRDICMFITSNVVMFPKDFVHLVKYANLDKHRQLVGDAYEVLTYSLSSNRSIKSRKFFSQFVKIGDVLESRGFVSGDIVTKNEMKVARAYLELLD